MKRPITPLELGGLLLAAVAAMAIVLNILGGTVPATSRAQRQAEWEERMEQRRQANEAKRLENEAAGRVNGYSPDCERLESEVLLNAIEFTQATERLAEVSQSLKRLTASPELDSVAGMLEARRLARAQIGLLNIAESAAAEQVAAERCSGQAIPEQMQRDRAAFRSAAKSLRERAVWMEREATRILGG